VNTPNEILQAHTANTQKLVAQAGALWVTAGDKSDSAEGLGIDGRINLVHSLIDLGIKSYVACLENLLKVGGAIKLPGEASEPLPSDPIKVPPRPYPRQMTVDDPAFVRVGLPTTTIPKSAIAFIPPFLPAGVTEFQVVLTDNDYIGANYTGTITLTSIPATTNIAPDTTVVIVGL
jgi:hypothetical protein